MPNKTVNHVSHKKSVVTENGRPKLPTQDQIVYGEIAINYAKDVETISIKNNSDEIVTRSSDKVIEKKIAESNKLILDGLNGSIVMDMTTARAHDGVSPTTQIYYGSKDALNLVLSHMKIGTFKNGKLIKECAPGRITATRSGEPIAIDGTDGDVMLYTDTVLYRDRATIDGLTVSGSTATTHNVIGLGLVPHMIGSKDAKKFEPFAITPHYATKDVKLDWDSQACPHSIYNPNLETGNYRKPIAKFKETFKANGKGYMPGFVSSFDSSYRARKKDGGYQGLYYEFYENWLIAMFLELGSMHFTADNLFGKGCTCYYPNDDYWFNAEGNDGVSGLKRVHSNGTKVGYGRCMTDYNSGNTLGMKNPIEALVGNKFFDFTESLESIRIMDAIVKANLVDQIAPNKLFTYDADGNAVAADSNVDVTTGANMVPNKKYFTVRNVPNCQGLADGVMTAVVNIFVKLTMNDSSGDSVIWKFSHPVYRGLELFSGMFTQLEGIYWVQGNTYDGSKNTSWQEFYYANSCDDLDYLSGCTTALDDTMSSGETTSAQTLSWGLEDKMPLMLSGLTKGYYTSGNPDGWASATNYNQSLYAHTAFGGGESTYECGYMWKYGSSVNGLHIPNGYPNKSNMSGRWVNGSVAGCCLADAYAGRTFAANSSVRRGNDRYAGGFSHGHITLA